MRSCFIGLLHPLIVRKEPENGETELAPHLPLQLLHLCLDYQVNCFMGCDSNIEEVIRVFNENNEKLRELLHGLIPAIPTERECSCATALAGAVIG